MENLHEQIEEVDEYNHLLETVLIQVCEELDLDPDELVEMAMTRDREDELEKKERREMARGQMKKSDKTMDTLNRERASRKYLYHKGGRRTRIPMRGTPSRAAYDKRVERGRHDYDRSSKDPYKRGPKSAGKDVRSADN